MPQHLEGGISLTYDWTGRKPYSYGREWGLSGQLELKSGDTKYFRESRHNFRRNHQFRERSSIAKMSDIIAAPRAFL